MMSSNFLNTLYSYIKHKKSGESSIHVLVLKPDNVIISDSKDKAEALNMQYASHLTREPDDHECPPCDR